MRVSLQINLAPGDYPHARYILPHQLKLLSAQVDEVILIVDTNQGNGRFAEGWDEYKERLNDFLYVEIQHSFQVKIIPVDYSSSIKTEIAQYFFGRRDMPLKDFRGGPFYAYFFGLYKAGNDLVFHLDSDMILGGSSSNWTKEAVSFFKNDPECLIVSPLPGPPRLDDRLIKQDVARKISAYTWELNGMSTRIFMMDKSKFEVHKLKLLKPSLRNQVKAIVQGNDNADLPEHLISLFMVKHYLKRIDFLGTGKGLWSLHPPYRTATFYHDLPQLISRIAVNDLPEKQNGFYDIIDEVCDWSAARQKLKNNKWWRRKIYDRRNK